MRRLPDDRLVFDFTPRSAWDTRTRQSEDQPQLAEGHAAERASRQPGHLLPPHKPLRRQYKGWAKSVHSGGWARHALHVLRPSSGLDSWPSRPGVVSWR